MLTDLELRSRSLRRAVFVSIVVLLSAVPQSGSGYELDPLGDDFCGDGEFNYEFSDEGDEPWTTQLRLVVNAAANLWELEQEYLGTNLVTLDEGGSATWTILLNDVILEDPDVNGSTECDNRIIRLNDDLTGNQLQDVAAHELGHALGLQHVGDGDSADHEVPIMATCLNPGSTERSFSNDDAAAIQKEWAVVGLPGTLHANWGFERWQDATTPTYWSFFLNNSRTKIVSGHEFGDAALGWQPLALSGHMAQTVTVHRESVDLTARASIRRQYGGTITGAVTVFIEWKQRDYGADPECDWPTGMDENTVTFTTPGWNHLTSDTYVPTTSWVNLDFLPEVEMPDTGDAIAIRIRITSNVKDSAGQFIQIDFDNTRVWEEEEGGGDT